MDKDPELIGAELINENCLPEMIKEQFPDQGCLTVTKESKKTDTRAANIWSK